MSNTKWQSDNGSVQLYCGDCLEVMKGMAKQSVHCVVASPPYWGLRDYGVEGQLGLEKTPEEFTKKLVAIFRAVRRVLRDDGTVWINLGDSYNTQQAGNRTPSGFSQTRPSRVSGNGDQETVKHGRGLVAGLKPKDLCGIPWRVAFALQADGWYLRSDIIWSKPNPMPESCTDRPTKAHEYLFLLTKKPKYFYDADAIRETTGREASWNKWSQADGRQSPSGTLPEGVGVGFGSKKDSLTHPAGRNRRTVWTMPTQAYPDAHFATYPTALVEPCILAGTSEKGCCPECGKPWVRVVEKSRQSTRPGINTKCDAKTWDKDTMQTIPNRLDGNVIGNRDPQRHCSMSTTLGWEPGCECEHIHEGERTGRPWHPTQPCVVLDPFMGSGTTLQVARWLGRHGIGIELNAEYIDQAVKRIHQPRERQPRVKDAPGQLILFGDTNVHV